MEAAHQGRPVAGGTDIHGHTAAELIAERADASKPNMGLMSWSGAKVRKHDVHVPKNYLNKNELPLAIPEIREQREIANRVAASTAHTEQLVAATEAQQALKKSLMHDLLTGNERVSVNAKGWGLFG